MLLIVYIELMTLTCIAQPSVALHFPRYSIWPTILLITCVSIEHKPV
jgi:hypothetical protein